MISFTATPKRRVGEGVVVVGFSLSPSLQQEKRITVGNVSQTPHPVKLNNERENERERGLTDTK